MYYNIFREKGWDENWKNFHTNTKGCLHIRNPYKYGWFYCDDDELQFILNYVYL